MAILLAEFAGAAITIVIAGTFLTRYADAIGEHTGLGRTLAGLVLLAAATSLPELAVDCNLARMGSIDVALGDLLGSSLFNLLILAVLDMMHRGPGRMLSKIAAAHALSGTMSILMTAICLLFLLFPYQGTFAGAGPGPILLAVVYVLGLRLVYFDQEFAAQHADALTAVEKPPGNPERHHDPALPSLNRAARGYAAATLVILLAAPLLATAAEGLAEETGLGGTFVGTTLVALSTSLPEFVATLTAVRMRAFDLAVGNIFGSNTFNMVILLPVDGFFDGSALAAASSTHALTAVCTILVTSVAVLGLLYRPERRYWIVEADALLVMLMIIGSLVLIYYAR